MDHADKIARKFAKVRRNPEAVLTMKDPDTSLVFAAIYADNTIVQHVENPSIELQMMLTLIPNTFDHIEHPNHHAQMMLLDNSISNIRYINNPSDRAIERAIKADYHNLRCIRGPIKKKHQLMAIQQSSNAINMLHNPDDEVKYAAIKRSGSVIRHIESPTLDMQRAAINKAASAVAGIDNPSEEIQMLAIRKSPSVLNSIRKPTRAVIVEAIKGGNVHACDRLSDPTPEEKDLIAMCKLIKL